MSRYLRFRGAPAALSMTLLFLLSAAVAFGQSVSTVVSGTITSEQAATLTVTAANNVVKSISVGPDTLVLSRVAAQLSSIAQGDALGVAADRAEDGSLTATSINIFAPELWKRVKRGQFPMKSGQIMTNAEVAQLTPAASGYTLAMRVGDTTSAIRVPPTAEIHRIVALTIGDLKPGEHVIVRGALESDGSVKAASVNLEE
jgi:Domain of unknown function (DUF5666)